MLSLLARTERALGGWLAPAYGDALRFVPDLDQVEALAPEREALWKRIGAASLAVPRRSGRRVEGEVQEVPQVAADYCPSGGLQAPD